MQPTLHPGGGGNAKNMSGNGNQQQLSSTRDNTTHPSQMQDIQRFQQQLQAVQYRQQQQQQQLQYGGRSTPTSMGMGMMQPSNQEQQHSTMNHTNSLANMMQPNVPSGMGMQQQSLQGIGNGNMSGTNASMGGLQQFSSGNGSTGMFVNWNNPTTSQQQEYSNNGGTIDTYNHFDTTGHTNQRLMSMSGMMSGNNTGVSSKGNPYTTSSSAATSSSGMPSLMGQQLSDTNVNSVLTNTANSSTALQNMQMFLLKQQQQQQGNRPVGLPSAQSTFNSSQQFSAGASMTSTPSTMGMQGVGGLATNSSSGTVGGGTSQQQQQQQMLLFQQQLAALKQQQISGVGGGSVAANAAMVAMQQTSMQQQQRSSNNNNLYPQQLQNTSNVLNSNLQQNTMQKNQIHSRQQQISNHMQQQQQLNRSVPDNSDGNQAFMGNNNIHSMQQSGNQSIMRQMSSSTPGMFNMMPPQQLQQQLQGSGLESTQLQSGGSTMNAVSSMMNSSTKYSQQSGLMGTQSNNINNIMLNNRDHHQSNIGQAHLNDTSIELQPQLQNSTDGLNRIPLSADQTPFLDGRFAGGWQSNADLPERRRVIFSILDVIRQMRPDTSKLSNKYVLSRQFFQRLFITVCLNLCCL
jgi:hypothetical protein